MNLITFNYLKYITKPLKLQPRTKAELGTGQGPKIFRDMVKLKNGLA